MNLYRIFYDVAKNGSISKTAEKNFTSQPAISRSIKKLEDELDAVLFYRTLSGMQLTEKGKILFSHVDRAFGDIKTAENRLMELENLERGKVSIGVPSQIASFYLFDDLANFHRMFPHIEITIVGSSTTKLLGLLKNHEVDFVIDTSPVPELVGYRQVSLDRFENCFISSKNSIKSEIKSIKSLRDLENFSLVLPIPGTANRIDLEKIFEKNNVLVKNVINIHTTEMIIGAVKRDLGIGYVLKNLVEDQIRFGELELVSISEPLPETEIVLVYDEKSQSESSRYFIENFLGIN